MEQHRIQRRLLELDVELVTSHAVVGLVGRTARGDVRLHRPRAHDRRRRGRVRHRAAAGRLRLPRARRARPRWAEAGLRTVKAVGDCWAPGTIAAAVWEGHRYAEELDEPDDRGDTVPFRREVTELTPD